VATPTYIFGASVSGQAGVLNTNTYSVTHTPSNLSTTGAHMNSGEWLQFVITNARRKLVHAKPDWYEQMDIQGGNRPVATYFTFSELNFANGTALEADPDAFKIAEGVTPNHNLKMTVAQNTISPQQYGLVVYYTDVIDQVSFIKFSTKLHERMAWGLARIMDETTRLHMKAGLSAYNFAASADGAGAMTMKRLLRLRAQLERLDVPPPDSEGGNYPMIIHPDQQYDLFNDASILKALESGPLIKERLTGDPGTFLGSAFGFNFYRTTGCTTTVDGSQVKTGYENFVIGHEMMAVTSFNAPDVGAKFNMGAVYNQGGAEAWNSGNNMSPPVELIEKPLGSSGVFDPLNQIQSKGAKWTHGLKMVNPTHGIKGAMTSNYMS
jgi:N4-gp56 family major capsid protein